MNKGFGIGSIIVIIALILIIGGYVYYNQGTETPTTEPEATDVVGGVGAIDLETGSTTEEAASGTEATAPATGAEEATVTTDK